MLFTMVLFLAQAYGCGGYGAASYNQCPVSSVQQRTTPTSNTTSQSASAATTPNNSHTSSTPSLSSQSPQTTAVTGTPNALVASVANVNYSLLLAIAFGIALCIALILLL